MSVVQTNSRAIRERKGRRSGNRSPSPGRADLRYITRIDSKRTHCWWVRFQRVLADGSVRPIVGKTIPDARHGGKLKAHAAAKAFRDRAARLVPPPRRIPRNVGHGYVRRTEIGGRPVWEGWIRLEGKRCSRTKWFIDVWGSRVAKRRCTEWLERKRGELGRKMREVAP
jgi:hypothetical protein